MEWKKSTFKAAREAQGIPQKDMGLIAAQNLNSGTVNTTKVLHTASSSLK